MSNQATSEGSYVVRPLVAVAIRNEMQLEKQLRDLRAEVRNLVVIGMRPDLLPEEVEFVRNLERSARADAKLLLKVIRHGKERASTIPAATTSQNTC